MGRVRVVSAGGGERGGGQFVRSVAVAPPAEASGYPYTLPAVAALVRSGLALAPGATFLVGENGSGKSTLLEAIAVALGFNAEGGSRNFRFATRASESPLGEHLTLRRGTGRPRTGFFLRAETYYNVATEIERLDEEEDAGPKLMPAYGGRSPHERSHGESFLDLLTHRFGPGGLYLLDEPEAALSVTGCLAALHRLTELVAQGSQVLVATHSPILPALPGATILEIDEAGELAPVPFERCLPVRLTRDFLADPVRYVRRL